MAAEPPRGKLLFISPAMPDIGGNGLAMRAGNLVEALGSHWDLHLLVLAVGGVAGRQLNPALAPFVAEWSELPYAEMLDPAYLRIARASPGKDQLAAIDNFGRPLAVAYRPDAAADAAFAAFPGVAFETVFVLRLYMSAVAARFLDVAPRPHMLLDADDDDVTASRRFARVRRDAGDPYGASVELATARHYGVWEQVWLPAFDLVFTASPDDSVRMSERLPDVLFDTLPNVVRTLPGRDARVGDVSADPFLMIGNLSYLPNVAGAQFFCVEVLPRLRAEAPDLARVTIAGSSPAPSVVAMGGETGVTVLANPADVGPLYDRARVAVVPLQAGGGTRIKILEAFAAGVPVVSTSLGAEGLDVRHGQHLLIADTPADFAAACIRLARDEALRDTITAAARNLQAEQYSLETLKRRFAGNAA